MNNIIIPVIGVDQLEFVEEVKKLKNIKIIIGITEEISKNLKKTTKKNVIVKVFTNGAKKEEIINSLRDQIDEGRVLICRKAITKEEINEFFKVNSDIAVCDVKRNKFQAFFFNLWQEFMSILFGFKLFEGDVSVVMFNENLFKVISNIENLSYASRVNKWKGVSVKSINTQSPPIKKEYDKLKSNLMLYGWISLFLAIIASTIVYFIFVKATFLTGLLFASAILIAQVGMLIAIAIFNLNIKVGQRIFKKAKAA